jgi:hypothetical protein
MPIEARLAMLAQKHAELDEDIHDEETRPQPDPTLLRHYKRQKLRIKEEMETIRSRRVTEPA